MLQLYSDCPPVRQHEVQRAHQLLHHLRAFDLSEQATFDEVRDCLFRGGFQREALKLTDSAHCEDFAVCDSLICASLECSFYPPFLAKLSSSPVVWRSKPSPSACLQDDPISTTVVGGVGSRHPSHYRSDLAKEVGKWVATRGYSGLSGGAVGCDTDFANGVLDAPNGTFMWHLLPCGLRTYVRSQGQNIRPTDGNAVGNNLHLCSIWPLDAPFSGYQAMVRNAQIYASATATFVFSAHPNEGGSWGGAVAALRARRPVIAIIGPECQTDPCQVAMRRLCNLGAIPADLTSAQLGTNAFHDVLDHCLKVAQDRITFNTGLFAQTA